MPRPELSEHFFGDESAYVRFVIKLIVRWQKYAKRGIDILRLTQGTLEYTIDFGLADIFVAAVSAPLVMPLCDSDIPMNVPFTFRNKQPPHTVQRETTSRGLCGLVCPSRTSERGG